MYLYELKILREYLMFSIGRSLVLSSWLIAMKTLL
jgi:hypothetical protein